MPHFPVTAEDFKDSDAPARRMQVYEQHLERIRVKETVGNIIFGGARLCQRWFTLID